MAKQLLLGAIVVCFCVRNVPWQLDDFDQAKQAYVSYEMVGQGHWWFQHTPVGNVATKPPLAGWISAALFSVTRWWDGAWRIPSLASALLLLALLWRSGERIWPELGGLVAAGMFGLNLMAPRLATLVRTDMLLTLFISLTGFVIYEKVRTGSPWTTRERWAVFAFVLGSMLTKGPIAYAFLLPGLLAFILLCQKRRVPANAWSGAWTWFLPLFIFLAWAGIGIACNHEFYEQVVLKEFLGRFTVGEHAVHKNQPLYFYLTHILRDFLPWSLLLLALPFWKNVRRVFADRAALWLICWSLGGLVFMSLVPSKRPDRIFPVIPPLCLLLAHFFREFEAAGQPAGRLARLSLFLGFLIGGSYTAGNIIESYREKDYVLTRFGARVRDYAQRHDLRYAIAASKDEGLLLYLHQPGFLKIRDAENAWRAGQIDALIVNEDDFLRKAPAFQPSALTDASGIGEDKSSQYFFLVRTPVAR